MPSVNGLLKWHFARGRLRRRRILRRFLRRSRCGPDGALFLGRPGHLLSGLRDASQELHVLGDDLNGGPLLPLRGFPTPALEPPLDAHRAALRQVFPAQLRLTAPRHHPDEAGVFPLLTGGQRVRPVAGHGERRDRRPAGDVPQLGIPRDVPDQKHLIQTGHGSPPPAATLLPLTAPRAGAGLSPATGPTAPAAPPRTEPAGSGGAGKTRPACDGSGTPAAVCPTPASAPRPPRAW